MKCFSTTQVTAIAAFLATTAFASPILEARQGVVVGCASTRETRVVGDGNPHTDVLRKQVSSVVSCTDGTCSVGAEQSTSYSIGFSVDLNPFPDEWDFISAGFDVSKEISTGETDTCNADVQQSVCIWKYIPHTAYTVREWETSNCQSDGQWVGDEHIMRSPITNGASQYCVRGSCRTQGEEYWEYDV